LSQRLRRQVLLKHLYVFTKCQTSRPRRKLPSRINYVCPFSMFKCPLCPCIYCSVPCVPAFTALSLVCLHLLLCPLCPCIYCSVPCVPAFTALSLVCLHLLLCFLVLFLSLCFFFSLHICAYILALSEYTLVLMAFSVAGSLFTVFKTSMSAFSARFLLLHLPVTVLLLLKSDIASFSILSTG